MSAWLAIFFLLVAALVMMVTPEAGAVVGLDNESFARLIKLTAILIFVLAGAALFYRGQVAAAIRHVAIWTAMFFTAIGLYAYRGELAVVADRVIGELRPEGSQINVGTKATQIKRGWSGHFIAKASISGKRVDMIVDTGASTVVLRHEDAKLLGFNMKDLRYTVPVQTANGSSFAARVRLGDVFIGQVGLANVEALVAKPGSLHQSLLGMSFLSRLRSYEFAGEILELRG